VPARVHRCEVRQQLDLLVPADQRRRGRPQCLEPALSSARSEHLPGADILSETLKSEGPEVAILERAAGQPLCARRDDDCTRLGPGLEASGKVRRLTDDRLFLGSSLADSAIEPTKSQSMTVTWRRSASSRRVGLVSTGAEGAARATEAPARSRIARSIFNRCPSETPRSLRY
jgi:hypothetical protein